ncbi:MAG: DUF2258 domain-containing protein [Nitrososphaeria archaeon]|jgi:hypothetical protein
MANNNKVNDETQTNETSTVPIQGKTTYQLSTGLIIAAGYANKLRRVALVSLGNSVPKDVIIRDISEINKKLFDELIIKNKIDKLDVIRLTVKLVYDPENKKLELGEYKIIRYLPEEKCTNVPQEDLLRLKEENEKLKGEMNTLKEKLKELEQMLSSA